MVRFLGQPVYVRVCVYVCMCVHMCVNRSPFFPQFPSPSMLVLPVGAEVSETRMEAIVSRRGSTFLEISNFL